MIETQKKVKKLIEHEIDIEWALKNVTYSMLTKEKLKLATSDIRVGRMLDVQYYSKKVRGGWDSKYKNLIKGSKGITCKTCTKIKKELKEFFIFFFKGMEAQAH